MRTIIILLLLAINYFIPQQNTTAIQYSQAWAKYRAGDYCGAVKNMDTVILSQQNDTLYEFRARLKYWCRDYKGSVLDFDKAILLSPQKKAALYIGRGFSKQAFDLAGALSDYTLAIKLNPKCGGYTYRADILSIEKHYKKAIADYTKEIEMQVDSAPILSYIYMSRAVAKYYLHDFKNSLADLDTSLNYDRNNNFSYEYKAKIFRDLGKKEDGCEVYKEAVYWGYTEFDSLAKRYCKQ